MNLPVQGKVNYDGSIAMRIAERAATRDHQHQDAGVLRGQRPPPPAERTANGYRDYGAAARALMIEDRESRRAATKARSEELAAERRATVVLPRSGESRRAALRTPGRLRLPRHQDTSATLAGAYPFLAEGGLGSEGVFIGQDLYSGCSFVTTRGCCTPRA